MIAEIINGERGERILWHHRANKFAPTKTIKVFFAIFASFAAINVFGLLMVKT